MNQPASAEWTSGPANQSFGERTGDLVSITTFEPDPVIVYVNPSFMRLLGYRPDDLLGRNAMDLLHPEDRERLAPLLEQHVMEKSNGVLVINGKAPRERLTPRIRDNSGNYHFLDGTADMLDDGHLLFVSKDVTEDMVTKKRLREDLASLEQRVKTLKEELADSKKVLKEEIFKRWRAGEALRVSEEENKRLLESFEDGYFEVDFAGNLTFFNESLCKLVGYSHQEMMGMNNRQYMTPETSKKVYETFNEVFRTGKATKAFDWELLKKDGQVRHVETSVSPVFGPDGEKIGFRGIARDVTERWVAEQGCRASDERYREILASIEDGYYEVDLRGDMVFFNESMCRILGYSGEELKGMNNRQYMSEETSKQVFQTFHQVYVSRESTKVLGWEMIRKGGEKKYLETIVSLRRGQQGEPIGFGGIARDVTELRLARKSVEESEEKYRSILKSIEDGYYEVDIKGNFIFFNESMCKILGYSDQELKGLNNREVMSEETSKKVFQTFNRVYVTGEPTKALGWELIRKDGERRYVETSVSLLRNPKGEPAGFRGIARDITGIKRLEKAKERAINHLSHELGTPLSVIEGTLKRIPDLVKARNTERIDELTDRINRNIKRLRDLQAKIDDILNEKPVQEKERILNLVEAAIGFLDELKDEPLQKGAEVIRQKVIKRLDSLHNVEELRKETIVLDTFIRQVCHEARLSLKNRKLEIVEKVEKEIAVEMDPKVLKKVCEGFLKNAIENTPDEGMIEIELKVEDHLARLNFHDSGTGITPENQELIFSGFFHSQDTNRYTSKKPYLFNAGGSGSDLLRARVLSERFGFSLDFSSTRCRHLPTDSDECPGSISSCPHIKGKEDCLSSGGSTFSLHLPLKRS